jgi:hypothetical protein
LYRKFVETGGTIEIRSDQIVVQFEKRSHNPLFSGFPEILHSN